jgi:hypothetical protein
MPANADPGLFQITRIPAGEKPAPGALAHGSIGPIIEHLNHNTRAIDAIAKAEAAVVRAEAIIRNHNEAFADALAKVSGRIDGLDARITALKQSEAERRDLDAETAGLKRYALPPEPVAAPDDEQPHGELTVHPPSAEERYDPEGRAGDTATGATPRELERNVPPAGGSGTEPELDPAELAHPSVPKYRDPAAVSLN